MKYSVDVYDFKIDNLEEEQNRLMEMDGDARKEYYISWQDHKVTGFKISAKTIDKWITWMGAVFEDIGWKPNIGDDFIINADGAATMLGMIKEIQEVKRPPYPDDLAYAINQWTIAFEKCIELGTFIYGVSIY